MILTIKLYEQKKPDGSHISMNWKNVPTMDGDWTPKMEEVWGDVKNGIHALIGNLGPIPEAGWEVDVTIKGVDFKW